MGSSESGDEKWEDITLWRVGFKDNSTTSLKLDEDREKLLKRVKEDYICKLEWYDDKKEGEVVRLHAYLLLYFDCGEKCVIEYQNGKELGGYATFMTSNRKGRDYKLQETSTDLMIHLDDFLKLATEFTKKEDYSLMTHNCRDFCKELWRNRSELTNKWKD